LISDAAIPELTEAIRHYLDECSEIDAVVETRVERVAAAEPS
jgi:hypothetical protein